MGRCVRTLNCKYIGYTEIRTNAAIHLSFIKVIRFCQTCFEKVLIQLCDTLKRVVSVIYPTLIDIDRVDNELKHL